MNYRRIERSREHLVFAAATAVIAIHVVDDAFMSVEPGASRADHLLAAAVPLGAAAATAWAYPRLRPGLRSALALAFGTLALVGAGVAVSDAAARGPRGDDWTGLLLAPAGLALLALGLEVLWRTRKRGGRRLLRRALIGAVAVAAFFELVLPIALAIVATHRPRDSVGGHDLGRPARDVRIRTRDGLELAGSYMPSRNGAAVITFPDRNWTVEQSRMLARRRYGVLALDMRGYGGSQGDPNSYGWGSRADLDAAVAYLRARPDVRGGRIGGLGLSVGGEQMIEAAAESRGLRAVVSEGAGERSVRETLERGAGAVLVLPQQAVQSAALAVLSGRAPPPSLRDLIARVAPRPLFLMYAARGAGGEDLNPSYYRAAGRPKELWKVPDASHTGGIDARPREYERRVVGFFDRALLGRR